MGVVQREVLDIKSHLKLLVRADELTEVSELQIPIL
jgi:hypothetical protein